MRVLVLGGLRSADTDEQAHQPKRRQDQRLNRSVSPALAASLLQRGAGGRAHAGYHQMFAIRTAYSCECRIRLIRSRSAKAPERFSLSAQVLRIVADSGARPSIAM
jgi:hypothetical protein